MGAECQYSFSDLYEAAHGSPMSQGVREALYGETQKERNERVQQWAQTAGWETQVRLGSDQQEYLAFCPNFSGLQGAKRQ